MEQPNQIIEKIKTRLVEEFRPEQIFLFGSYVWGIPHKDSDIDFLVIVKSSELSPTRRASFAYRCLRDIPFPLDILVKTQTEVQKFSEIPASLEHKILKHGKLIYG
jgi:predicted nucleotidyltransferase